MIDADATGCFRCLYVEEGGDGEVRADWLEFGRIVAAPLELDGHSHVTPAVGWRLSWLVMRVP